MNPSAHASFGTPGVAENRALPTTSSWIWTPSPHQLAHGGQSDVGSLFCCSRRPRQSTRSGFEGSSNPGSRVERHRIDPVVDGHDLRRSIPKRAAARPARKSLTVTTRSARSVARRRRGRLAGSLWSHKTTVECGAHRLRYRTTNASLWTTMTSVSPGTGAVATTEPPNSWRTPAKSTRTHGSIRIRPSNAAWRTKRRARALGQARRSWCRPRAMPSHRPGGNRHLVTKSRQLPDNSAATVATAPPVSGE